MRDFLEFLPPDDELERISADPVAKARALNRRELPKRFYQDAAVKPAAAGFAVELDGRPVKTPAKRALALPRQDLAEAIAAEWRAQGDHIDPATMPFTRLANSVIDGVAERRGEVVADLTAYAGSDLLCYRADSPVRLVERQMAVWDPILDWADERLGARFTVIEGVMHVAQEDDAIEAVRQAVAGLDPFVLAGLHSITTLTGSVLIAVALWDGYLDIDAAWLAGSLDDHWSLEVWGHDADAAERLEHRRSEFLAAAAFLGGGRTD
ncbi:MAG: ATP12 family protein [Ancalomicrobiaceae bacterium]|nr:ATP12 family protein [Ancalomicrobiaceae bacterium]